MGPDGRARWIEKEEDGIEEREKDSQTRAVWSSKFQRFRMGLGWTLQIEEIKLNEFWMISNKKHRQCFYSTYTVIIIYIY